MRRAALACALALLSGCAMVDRTAPVGDAAPSRARALPSPQGESLYRYLDQLKDMGEPALATEAARQKQLVTRNPSDATRVRAAMAMLLAKSGDDGEVAAVLEPVTKGDSDADLKSMASFLQALVADRRRLRESAAASGSRLRDERRAAEAQKLRADALQERAAQLQQKLDALTELEKSLSDRQPPSR
jgi:hypothetical protein